MEMRTEKLDTSLSMILIMEIRNSKWKYDLSLINNNLNIFLQSSIKFPAGDEEAGVYNEMRDRDNNKVMITHSIYVILIIIQTEHHSCSTAEVTMLPVTILGAIGNIGGRAVKSTEGLYLTTNTGPLHVKVIAYLFVGKRLVKRLLNYR